MLPLAVTQPTPPKGRRTLFHLATTVQTKAGLAVQPVKSMGSADIIAACQAEGIIVLPAKGRDIPVGSMVEFHPWKKA